MASPSNTAEVSHGGDALVAVTRAAQLAREGGHADAEALLTALPPAERGLAPVLDLRARLAAQRGRYAEAQAFWGEALRLEPENAGYAAGQRRARAAEQQPWRRVPLLWPLLVAFLALCLGAGLLRIERSPTQTLSLAATASTASPVAAPVEAAPALTLDAAGVSSRPDGAALCLTFDAGLFDVGTRLTPTGAETLRVLARSLEARAHADGASLHVTLIGHTDDRPVPPGRRYPDNAALGLARAAVVYERLRSAALPASAFSLRSGGEQPPAASGPGPEPAQRRTVVVRLTRAAEAR